MPFAVYRLESRTALYAGQSIRLNFDRSISDDAGLVSSGPAWSFRAPADGVYFIQANVQLSPGADVVVTTKGRQQAAATPRVLATSPYVATRIPAGQVQTMAFLTRRDEVWFEAGHSVGDNPQVYAVDGIASIALLYPTA